MFRLLALLTVLGSALAVIDWGDSSQAALSRLLAIGDFDGFNEALQGVSLQLGDLPQIEQFILISQLVINLRDVECRDIQIGDIVASFNVTNATDADGDAVDELTFDLAATPFSMNCYANYSYSFAGLRSSGIMTANSRNNNFAVTLGFQSPSFEEHPPNTTVVNDCQTEVDIYNLEFSTGLEAIIVALFERAVANLVESQAAGAVCSDASKLFGILDTILADANEVLEELMLPAETVDIVEYESSLTLPEGDILPINTGEGQWGSLVREVIGEAEAMLSEEVKDGEGTDLAINVWLRNYMLDEDRALPVDLNFTLMNDHDKVLQSNIVVESARIKGLDTFSIFEPIGSAGNYTLTNRIAWDFLSFEVTILADMRSSSLPDSLILSSEPLRNVEQLTIKMDISNVDIDMAVLLAADLQTLEATEVGSIMFMNKLIPCLMKTMAAVDIPSLFVSVEDLGMVTVDGFTSPGFQRLFRSMIQAAFTMYKPSIVKAIPGAFAGPVRKSVVSDFVDPLIKAERQCGSHDSLNEYVDFRDLFLLPSESKALGGSGSQQYGEVTPFVRDLFVSQLESYDDGDDLLGVNRVLIRPITKQQSGEAGTLAISDLASLAFALGDDSQAVSLSLREMRVSNLDTISLPLEIAEPTSTADGLNNMLNAGFPERPVSMVLALGVNTTGDFFPSAGGYDELEVEMTIGSAELLAELSALISAKSLMSLSLGDVFNIDCVLSLFGGMEGASIPLSVGRFATVFESIVLDVTCVDCSGSGAAAIPDVVDILLQPGVSNIIANKFGGLASSIVESEAITEAFSGAISSSYRFCPSHDLFDSEAIRSSTPLKFPLLEAGDIDFLLYSGVVVGWGSFVVLSEGLASSEERESNPLASQEDFVPQGNNYIDWMNLADSFSLGTLLDEAFDRANDILTARSDTGDIGINTFLRDLLGDGATLDTTFDDFKFAIDDFEFSVDRIRATGLDTFTNFSGIQPIGPQTLQMTMELRGVDVQLDLSASYQSSPLSQNMTLSMGVDKVSLDVALFAAFDLDKIGDLTIGSLLDLDNILPCLLSSAEDFQIPHLKLSLDAFSPPTITGLGSETMASASNFLMVTTEQYSESILAALPRFVEGPVRQMAENLLEAGTSERYCTQREAFSASSLVDFRDLLLTKDDSAQLGGTGDGKYGDVMSMLLEWVNKNVIATDVDTGLSKFNEILVDPVTRTQSGEEGTWSMKSSFINEDLYFVMLDANIRLRIYNTVVRNLNTLGKPLGIFDAADFNMLKNIATIGIGKPLKLGTRLLFGIRGDDSEIRNEVDLQAEVSNFSIILDMIINLLEEPFFNFPLRDITNTNCWMAAMPAPVLDSRGVRYAGEDNPYSIVNFETLFDNIKFNVTCVECSSPEMAEVTKRLSTSEGGGSASNFAEGLMDIVMDFVGGDSLYLNIDRMMANARTRCPHSEEYDPTATGQEFDPFKKIKRDDSVEFLLAVLLTTIVVAIAVSAFLVFVRVVVRRRHRKWLVTLSDHQVMALWQHQQKEKESCIQLNQISTSLFTSPCIPFIVRLAIPVIIVGNICLFLSGHLSPAASVNGRMTLAGDTFKVTDMFQFSIARGAINVWRAGGKELAILIVLFSGVWPYTKQLISLFLWFAPPSRVSCQTRLKTFLWLDFLAKWSMVDIFTLLISLVAFRVSVTSPELEFLPENFYTIDLLVIPKLGTYANFVAQVVSQVSSHFIIYYDRKTTRLSKLTAEQKNESPDSREEETPSESHDAQSPATTVGMISKTYREHVATASGAEESLSSHAYARPHRGEDDRLFVRPIFRAFVIICALVSVSLVAVGCVLPSFTSEILGIFGLIVESGSKFQDEAVSSYSLFGMMKLLFKQAEFRDQMGDYVGLGSLVALLLITVLVVPVIQVMVLAYHWFSPLSRMWRKRIIVLNEVLQAWQYAEVFAVSVLAGAWQLGSVSHFMMNIYCDYITGLKSMFARLVYFGFLQGEDAQCFLIEASPDSGFFVLTCGALVLALLNSYVTKAASQYLRDKEGAQGKPFASVVNEACVLDSAREIVDPVPAMFTDRFRWLMRSETKATDGTQEAPNDLYLTGSHGPFTNAGSMNDSSEESSERSLVV